jgi:3-hydroxybutyryl-CoA dehydrogenase
MVPVAGFKVIGVVGLGIMGTGIAQVAAMADYDVVALDSEKSLVDRSIARIAFSLQRMVEKGIFPETVPENILSRIKGSSDLEAMSDCDLIIEAVYEDYNSKRAIFEKLDVICDEKTVFASNTSTLDITGLCSGLKRSDRFLGLHFFNPVPVMKLVEVVRTAVTSEDAINRSLDFVISLDKRPVQVRDQAGFLVNYLLTPYLFDAIRALSAGLASVSDIDSGMRYGCGHPMGPLALSDLIGLDTLFKAGNILFDEYRESRYSPPPLLKRLVSLGDLGVKSGRGFYDYTGSKGGNPRDLIGF